LTDDHKTERWPTEGTEGSEDDPETFATIGAAIEVQRHLGHGFLESVYHEALAAEFDLGRIPYRREADLSVRYKGRVLPCSFRADFLCLGDVIVELKALAEITAREHSQVINYLKATGFARGPLLNFGTPRLGEKRFILT
jgi:GxxExxY protein